MLIPTLLMVGISFAQNLENEVFTEAKITKATIFRQSAQIKSMASVEINSGQSTVVIGNISTQIDASTIQVKALGDFTILGVSNRRNFMKSPEKNEDIELLEDSLKLVLKEIKQTQGKISILDEERKMILNNNKISWEKTGFAIEDIEDLSNFYRNRLGSIFDIKLVLEENLDQFQQSKQIIERQLREIKASTSTPATEVLITVSSSKNQKVDFELEYVTFNAGWNIFYEARANSGSDEIELVSMANVYQNTGMDWIGINLSLSSSNPSKSTTKPELSTWLLNFYEVPNYSLSNRAMPMAGIAMEEASMDSGDKMAGSAADYMVQSEGDLSLNYDLSIPYSIPGNGKAQVAELKKEKLKANFYHYAAPKLNPSVYLMAELLEAQSLSMLSGAINLYFDNNFVGKSNLDMQQTKESLAFSFGVDEMISISREKNKDFGGNKIVGSNRQHEIGNKIVVKNNKKSSIKIKIQDQIPVSGDKEISVKWLSTDDGNLNKDNGIVTWEFDLQAAQSKSMELKYEVKYPQDKNINF